MNDVYLITGGNLGDKMSNLSAAAALIHSNAGCIICQSSIYQTEAWGGIAQPAYLNQVLQIKTDFSAPELLGILQQIETKLGRVRKEKYGARIIDIDILFFNQQIIHIPQLTIPHPKIQNRRFVLIPLAEIAPAYQHPVLQQTIAQLLANCSDMLNVNKFSEE